MSFFRGLVDFLRRFIGGGEHALPVEDARPKSQPTKDEQTDDLPVKVPTPKSHAAHGERQSARDKAREIEDAKKEERKKRKEARRQRKEARALRVKSRRKKRSQAALGDPTVSEETHEFDETEQAPSEDAPQQPIKATEDGNPTKTTETQGALRDETVEGELTSSAEATQEEKSVGAENTIDLDPNQKAIQRRRSTLR